MAMTKPSSSQVTYSGTTVNKALEKSVLSYDTYTVASAAAATLPDGQLVDTEAEQMRYRVEAGGLAFVRNLDQLEIDLNDPDEGARLIAYKAAATEAVLRTLYERFAQSPVTPEDFGAVGDGVADDTVAWQKFINHLCANGGAGFFPPKTYLWSASVSNILPAKGFYLFGCGGQSLIKFRSSAPGNTTPLAIIGPHDTLLENFNIDVGYSVTGTGTHGYSFSDPNRVIVRNVNAFDYRGTGGIMFLRAATATSTSQNSNGTYRNCFIIDSAADGNGNGQNGFLLECLYASAIINCHVRRLDKAGSPSVGLQLKNECRYSHIIGGSAEDCIEGVALGGDGGTAGSAGYFCSILDTAVKNSTRGGSFSKTTNCKVRILVDMVDNAANTHALNIAGLNTGLDVELVAANVPTGGVVLHHGSSNTTARIKMLSSVVGRTLVSIGSGANFTVTYVDKVLGGTSSFNVLPYVSDASGQSSNTVVYSPGCTVSGLNNLAQYHFHTSSGGQAYALYSGSTFTYTFRNNGANTFNIAPGSITPAADGILSGGTSALRFSQFFAQTATVSTSDEREKSEPLPIDDAVLDAWGDVKIIVFQWLEAIDKKGADSARWHFGVIAQRVRDAFLNRGLDGTRYGLLCYDEWEEVPAVLDETGNVVVPAQQAGNRWGIRADQCLFLEAAYQRRRADRIEARLTAIEAKL